MRNPRPDAASTEPLVGRSLGDALIVGRLGLSSLGRVLHGLERPALTRSLAVKVLEPPRPPSDVPIAFVGEVERVARQLRALDVAGLVPPMQLGFDEHVYLTVPLVAGARPLDDAVSLEALLALFADAHARGVVHGALTPESALVDADGAVHVVDFGLAACLDALRDTGLALPLRYRAPEDLTGRPLTAATDVYQLGCIAFEVVLGRAAFTGPDTQMVLEQKLVARFDASEPYADILSPRWREVLRRALATDPRARFHDACEMLAALTTVRRRS